MRSRSERIQPPGVSSWATGNARPSKLARLGTNSVLPMPRSLALSPPDLVASSWSWSRKTQPSFPVTGKSFVPMYPNREERRQNLQKSRFHGESGNVHLTVLPTGAYKRVRQLIKLASKKLHAQKTKTIDHYRLIHKSVRDQKVELVNP